jgi:hypothetical protein
MFVHAIFARSGRQNRVFGQNATEREKRRDWLAERIGFELEWRFAALSRFLGRKSPDCDEIRKQRITTPEKVDRLRAVLMRFEPMVRFAPHHVGLGGPNILFPPLARTSPR